MQFRVGLAAAVMAAVFGCLCSAAFAANPGWECVPTTAGQAVTSGGTAPTPNCGPGNSSGTPVLAPTYVGNTVGGKPTVQFSGAPGTGVNVQIVNGMTSTATDNGAGNLVIGYNESPGNQAGSHNLLIGGPGLSTPTPATEASSRAPLTKLAAPTHRSSAAIPTPPRAHSAPSAAASSTSRQTIPRRSAAGATT